MRAAPCVLPILKIFSKKFIFVIDISFGIPYNTSCCGNKAQRIGLSPNGKATDSDSVIFKVRILVALLAESSHGLRAFSFTNVESCEKYYVCKKVHAGA